MHEVFFKKNTHTSNNELIYDPKKTFLIYIFPPVLFNAQFNAALLSLDVFIGSFSKSHLLLPEINLTHCIVVTWTNGLQRFVNQLFCQSTITHHAYYMRRHSKKIIKPDVFLADLRWMVPDSHNTLVASIWSCSESMNRSPTGSQASLTPSACSSATASSSMAAWICSSLSRVRSMCRCRSTQRAVNFSHRSLDTLACFHTERLTLSIRRRGERSAMEIRGREERTALSQKCETTVLIFQLVDADTGLRVHLRDLCKYPHGLWLAVSQKLH